MPNARTKKAGTAVKKAVGRSAKKPVGKIAGKAALRTAKSSVKPVARKPVSKPAESPDVWATRILLHSHAIAPCAAHGFMKLKFHHAAIDYAHALAAADPLPGKSRKKSAEVLDEFLDGLGDDCPAC